MRLGTAVEQALNSVGVNEASIQLWLGFTCSGCKSRKEALDQLSEWAHRRLMGRAGLRELMLVLIGWRRKK